MLRLLMPLVVVMLPACSRTPERICNVTETSGCDQLLATQSAEEALFESAVVAGDGQTASEAGECAQFAARERLERSCLFGVVALCAEACRLHPCRVLDGDCESSCEGTALADGVMADVITRAADNPGFCTCAVCDDQSKALCEQVWDCS